MSLEDVPSSENSNKELFQTVNMLDSRLCVQDQISYAVEKGPAQLSQHYQAASSFSATGATFSIVVPALSCVVSRRVLLRANLTLTITLPGGAGTDGQFALNPNSFCVAPFPWHNLCTTISCTINNQTFTFDCQNQLNEVLKCLDPEILNEYNNFTPSQLDSYGKYSDVAQFVGGAPNNNFSGVVDSPFRSGVLLDKNKYTRGTYIKSVAINAAAGANAANTSVATVQLYIVEPLIMSPFLMSNSKSGNCGGLYGIQNMNFNFQFNTSNNRVLRMPGMAAGTTITIGNVVPDDAILQFEYLTPMPSLKLSARSIVPHLQLQTFKASVPFTANGTDVQINSNSIQLSLIPDSVIICVRKIAGNKTYADADAYLPLSGGQSAQGNVQINFNNQPGILSSATNEKLYSMSCEAGLNQTWPEFLGQVNISPPSSYAALAAGVYGVQTGVPTATAGLVSINTCGPVLKFDFNKHIPVAADWYSSGSIGSFNFQCSIKANNNTGADIGANTYELVCIFVNSGIIVNSLGATSSYVGVLSKQAVLEASEKPPINKGNYERLLGGSWWSNMKAGIHKNAKYASKPQKGAGYSAGGKFSGRIL
jgi:hypothetical protein